MHIKTKHKDTLISATEGIICTTRLAGEDLAEFARETLELLLNYGILEETYQIITGRYN